MVKGQVKNFGKIFVVNHRQGLIIPKIQRVSENREKCFMWKYASNMNRKFIEMENQMTLSHMESCLTSLITKEMQLKRTVRNISHPSDGQKSKVWQQIWLKRLRINRNLYIYCLWELNCRASTEGNFPISSKIIYIYPLIQ